MIKQALLGTLGGLIISALAVVLSYRPSFSPETEAGALMAENSEHLAEIVIHYTSGAWPIVGRTYQDFLDALGPEVVVDVVTPNQDAFQELVNLLGQVSPHLRAVVVGHPVTPWSRDRFLVLEPANGPLVLYRPWEESLAGTWPERTGDQLVADDLAEALPQVTAVRAPIFFDAGDFVADQDTVFVTPAVLSKNLHRTVHSERELVKLLEGILKRSVVLLKEAPQHHAGMFMMAANAKTMLVGDPSLAKALSKESSGLAERLQKKLPGGADFSSESQRAYDSVAQQVEAAGYKVVRVPTVNAPNSRIYVTYLNGIIEEHSGKKSFYLPVYDDLPELNQRAAAIWRSLGFAVKAVNVSDAYLQGGTLHCLVNPLRRAD